MSRIEKTVFISYRRTNQMHALAVYQDLTHNGFDVFLDYNSIDSGSFEKIIFENVASRAHFILILTPTALERCAEPGDWLRGEIEYAIETKRNIVPLMFDGFDYSSPAIAQFLTGKLEPLKQYNAQTIPNGFFEEAMAKVRNRFLSVEVSAVLHPASSEAEDYARQGQEAAQAQPTVSEEALSAEGWLEKAWELHQAGEFDRALHTYTQAIIAQADYALAYNNRAALLIDLKKYQDAIRDSDEALRLQPDFSEAYNNRGLAQYHLKRFDEALKDLNEAIRLQPELANAHSNLGATYDSLKQFEQAIRHYNEAIRINPDLPLAYHNRGYTYQRMGDYQRAKADYEKALEINPKLTPARDNLNWLKVVMGASALWKGFRKGNAGKDTP